jgi:DNA polymerase
MSTLPKSNHNAREALVWQLEAGIDECIGEIPVDRFSVDAEKPSAVGSSSSKISELNTKVDVVSVSGNEIKRSARPQIKSTHLKNQFQSAGDLASACSTLEELEVAVRAFEGCTLKKTATNTVFADGNPQARIMFVGEAPGADEDRQGKPFVGASGKLFDKMVNSIGLDRNSLYITNILFWRPPGNRNPASNEIAVCLPFLERHIELVSPDILVPLGGPATKTILGVQEGITRLRGQWHPYQSKNLLTPIATIPLFHPAYLLRSPGHKGKTWQDLISIKDKLLELPD